MDFHTEFYSLCLACLRAKEPAHLVQKIGWPRLPINRGQPSESSRNN